MFLGAMVEPEIEMSLVRRLVVGEADVPVDTEQALIDAGVCRDSRVQFLELWAYRSDEAPSGFHIVRLIICSMGLEPGFGIVLGEVLQKRERLLRKALEIHPHSASPNRSVRWPGSERCVSHIDTP